MNNEILNFKEVSYVSSRNADTYERMFCKCGNIGIANAGDMAKLSPISTIPNLPFLNTQLILLQIVAAGAYIEDESEAICSEYKSITNNPPIHKIRINHLVTHMRLVFNNLIAYIYILIDYDKVLKDKKIKISSIGSVKNNSSHIIHDIIFGGNSYVKDETNFLNILNDVSNSFKHSILNAEALGIASANPNIPTIVSFYAKNNDLSKIEYHSHNLIEFMIGFQDNLNRIAKNQKIWETALNSNAKD